MFFFFFCRKERHAHTNTHTQRHKSVLLSYGLLTRARCVVVLYKGCICLLRIDSLNWLPKPHFFPSYISPWSLCFPAMAGLFFSLPLFLESGRIVEFKFFLKADLKGKKRRKKKSFRTPQRREKSQTSLMMTPQKLQLASQHKLVHLRIIPARAIKRKQNRKRK